MQAEPVAASRRNGVIDRPFADVLLHQGEHQHILDVHRCAGIEPSGQPARPEGEAARQDLREQRIDLCISPRMERRRQGLGRQVGEPRRLLRFEQAHRIVTQLFDVPIGIAQGEIHDGDIAPDPLDLLQIPQRERIVVTVREDDPVWLDGLQQVVGEIPRQRVHRRVGAARGFEVEHERKEGESQDAHHGRPAGGVRCADAVAQRACDAGDPNPDKQPPHQERDREEVVALAHFVLSGIRELREPYRVAGLEIHVAHEGRPRGDEQHDQQPEDRAVTIVELGGAVESERGEREGERQPDQREYWRGRSQAVGPLPVEVLQIVLQLEQHDREAPPRIVGTGIEQRVVDR